MILDLDPHVTHVMMTAMDCLCFIMLIIVLCNCCVVGKRGRLDLRTRLFVSATVLSMLALGCDVLGMSFPIKGAPQFVYFATMYMTFVVGMGISVCLVAYLLSWVREKHQIGLWPIKAVSIYSALAAVAVLVMECSGMLLSFSGDDIEIGSLFYIAQTICCVPFAFGCILIFRYGKALGHRDFCAMLSYIFFPIVGIVLEFIVPNSSFSYLGAALSVLVLFLFVQDRDIRHSLSEESKAKAIAETKSSFLAAMSHEIRTPLNAIIGFSEFLKDPSKESDGDRGEYIDGIYKSSKALMALINGILDLSKLDAGKLDTRDGKCNFAELFAEMDSFFKFRAIQKGIGFEHSIAVDFPVLGLNADRFRQVLVNIIGNAVKFTDVGKVEFGAAYDTAGRMLSIFVKDTGPGIANNKLESIFDPFAQDSGVRGGRVYEGTGLGLPISKRLVEAAGGEISVESKVGEGSIFTIRVPDVPIVEENGVQAASVSANPSLPRPLPDAAKSSIFVVAVDDVKMNLLVIRQHLKRAGIPDANIEIFTDPREALEALGKLVTDLPRLARLIVFTDMWMPDMNGEMLARAIKSEESMKNVELYAVTADANSQNTFDMSLFDCIITKPVTGDKVAEVLERCKK